jgi:hypothetical protein
MIVLALPQIFNVLYFFRERKFMSSKIAICVAAAFLSIGACKQRNFGEGSGEIKSIAKSWPVLNSDGSEQKLPYSVFEEYPANNCEIYVNAVATGSQYVYAPASYEFFLTNLVVNKENLERQGTHIVNVGMLVMYTETKVDSGKSPVTKEGFVLASALAGKLVEYEIRMQTDGTDTRGKSTKRQIQTVSYFIDVLRGSEGYVRMWNTDAGKAFTMASIFSNYKRNDESGSASYSWLDGNAPSPVFNQKRSCVK